MDILLVLFITVFFIYKLKNNFGIRNEDDEKRRKAIEEFFRQKYGNNSNSGVVINDIIDVTNDSAVSNEEKGHDLNLSLNVSNNVKSKLERINFDEKNFLDGVESAVEMINDAFSNKDLDTLHEMLSEHVFLNFKKQIDALNMQNKILKSSLISVKTRKIENISIVNNMIKITVFLEMEQINFIENKKKQVVLGDKKKIELVKELWTFERDINSKKNFWIVDNVDSVK